MWVNNLSWLNFHIQRIISMWTYMLFSNEIVSDFLRPHGLKHARLPCPSLSPRVCANSCILRLWCHPTISSSVIPFSSSPQSFQHEGLYQWVGSLYQVAKVLEFSASASILPMNIQGCFPLGLTGLISLLSKGLSRVFSSTTIWKHEFFGTQLSLWSKSHIHTWLLEKP